MGDAARACRVGDVSVVSSEQVLDPTHYLDRDDWAKLAIPRGSGVFVTFGCNGCQLNGEGGEGYGVAAVRNPDQTMQAVTSVPHRQGQAA